MRILALIVLMALAIGFASLASWQGGFPANEWRILPGALVLLVSLFGMYIWSKGAEMAELRGLVRGLEHRDDSLPDLNQLEKLFGMVQRSQQGYRDLIDTFDDLLFSVSPSMGRSLRPTAAVRIPARPAIRGSGRASA